MIEFELNGKATFFEGDGKLSLLKYLRLHCGITSVKDGCSCQAACGACMVEMDGKPTLSCVTPLKNLQGRKINTLEGLPARVRDILAKAFVSKGAVQCGFCSPGFLMRAHLLLKENPNPSREEIYRSLKQNLCRCTGYVKIVDAIAEAAQPIANGKNILLEDSGDVGKSFPKYQAMETALGQRAFVNDLNFPGMKYGALRFSDHPKAVIKSINTTAAAAMPGVIRVFTASDIPGDKMSGLIFKDWPLMIAVGETTRYIGDVISAVTAETEDQARAAAAAIEVEYEILTPVTDPFDALKEDAPQVHPNCSNLLENCRVYRDGNADEVLSASKWVAQGRYSTQRIEHAFLETEGAVAIPDGNGLHLYTNSQGIYVDRKQIAVQLDIPEEDLRITLVPTGGGFGGKEDLSVQGHASLMAFLLKQAVKVVLSRPESMRMHPKRHPVFMDISIGCDEEGNFTAAKLNAVGDSGAYASVGTKVMERVAGHATGAYYFPVVNLEALTVYTNNIPSGAMRGFGANQAAFALESCIDDLCRQAGFDPWQIRYKNALDIGKKTSTGQVLTAGVGVKACLEKLKPFYDQALFKGLACGIKNSGVGNGMPDFSDVIITVHPSAMVEIQHGWTEMGQGIHNMAIQTLVHECGIPAHNIQVHVDTQAGITTGMTTSSRATALLGLAIIDACRALKSDLQNHTLAQLAGKSYTGNYTCDWTTKPGANVEKVITHYSYGYAAQMVELDAQGEIKTVYAAHDAGKVMNPLMFEGQIEGAVHMGLGYALTEDFPMENGQVLSYRLRDLGIIPPHQMPEIVVLGVEVPDAVGPYGAKGLGEIGLVPTAAAVANAFCNYDGQRRFHLPLKKKSHEHTPTKRNLG